MKTMTKDITINGETRQVEFWVINDQKAISREPVANFQKNGGKIWAHSITLWLESGKINHNQVILNRNGYRLIGWNNDDQNSKHNSAH